MTIVDDYMGFFLEEFNRSVLRLEHYELMDACFEYADQKCPSGREAILARNDARELSTVYPSRGAKTEQELIGKEIMNRIQALKQVQESIAQHDRIYRSKEIVRRLKGIGEEILALADEVSGIILKHD